MKISKIANPRQVVLITTRARIKHYGKEEEKDNIFPIAWHTPLSFQPKMYGICVGKERFSYELIKQSKCFVVNFIDHTYKDKVLFCGMHSGKYIDKFKETGFTKEEAETIDCPYIKEALAILECKVIDEIPTGDHVFFIANVLKQKIFKEGKRLFHLGGENFGYIKY